MMGVTLWNNYSKLMSCGQIGRRQDCSLAIQDQGIVCIICYDANLISCSDGRNLGAKLLPGGNAGAVSIVLFYGI